LKYSGCEWPNDDSTLDEAEDLSLSNICSRAQIVDGMDIMDLGCGWGSLSLYILEKFPACRVTSVSNSSTQREHITGQAQARGYSERWHGITADANVFTTEKRFDRICSIEMFEHMRNYDALFSKVSSWLKTDGMLFTQILCHREFPYAFDTREGSDTEWMAKNFFSGGTMPSADLFLYFQKDVIQVDHWRINGTGYSRTLEAWLKLMDAKTEDVSAIMSATYGADQCEQQIFNWRLFFIFCSEVFGYKAGNEWIVAQHLFKKR